ncbi:hypothetical protein FORC25_2447 [Clostridium perfringens]|nr:hypothetical protein FORC25_2447 [Clostridium perfringens]
MKLGNKNYLILSMYRSFFRENFCIKFLNKKRMHKHPFFIVSYSL